MRLATFVVGVVFVATCFFLLPRACIALNDALGWPRLPRAPLLLGWGLVLAGVAIHVMAAGRFRRAGGTPVPTDPPSALVCDGLFGYSRNPIYIADLLILLGIFGIWGHLALLLYALAVGTALHIWVVAREEPVLRARFGVAWEDYCAEVPRWLGPLHRRHTI